MKEKFSALRQVIGLAPAGDVPQWFAGLNQRLSMPSGLTAMGVPQARLGEFAAEAMTDSSHPSNPRPMQPADYRRVLETAM